MRFLVWSHNLEFHRYKTFATKISYDENKQSTICHTAYETKTNLIFHFISKTDLCIQYKHTRQSKATARCLLLFCSRSCVCLAGPSVVPAVHQNSFPDSYKGGDNLEFLPSYRYLRLDRKIAGVLSG